MVAYLLTNKSEFIRDKLVSFTKDGIEELFVPGFHIIESGYIVDYSQGNSFYRVRTLSSFG